LARDPRWLGRERARSGGGKYRPNNNTPEVAGPRRVGLRRARKKWRGAKAPADALILSTHLFLRAIAAKAQVAVKQSVEIVEN